MKIRLITLVNLLLMILFAITQTPAPVQAQGELPQVVVVTLEGPLTPVWSGYLERGINKALDNGANLVVVELNTPGGSVDLMNNLVQQILASPVPVAVYVTPRGAMAASAGTLLVLSGHIAAMAPETTIGAASPVGMQGEDIESTLETKTKEILKASVRSLAARRGEAAVSLAEASIESAKAANSTEALKVNLIDFIAYDIEDLLKQIDGSTVTMNGNEVVIRSAGAVLVPVATSFIEDALGLLTNPNIVFLLLTIGVQAILIEISSPGGWIAGFLGTVMVLLAVYGMGVLPVNWFGAIFLVIAIVLFIMDIKAPTHGALTAAGVGTFIAGSLILFNSVSMPGFPKVSVWLVVSMGIFLGLTFFAVVMIAMRAMKKPIATGRESLVGQEGYAVTRIAPNGIAHVAGEQWSVHLADGEKTLPKGEKIIVEKVEGVRLVVRRLRD